MTETKHGKVFGAQLEKFSSRAHVFLSHFITLRQLVSLTGM